MTDQHSDPGSRALSAEDEEALARLTRVTRKAAVDADIALLDALLDAVEAGSLRLDFDRRVIAHPHSPISVSAQETQIAIGCVIAVIAALVLLGWQIAAGIAVACVAVYWFVVRGWLNNRMKRMAVRAFRANVETWRKTWAFGGVTLTPVAGGNACVAPDGSWRNLAQTLIDK